MANARGSYTYAIAVLDEPGWFDRFEDGAEAKDIALELPSSLEDAYEGLLADFERAVTMLDGDTKAADAAGPERENLKRTLPLQAAARADRDAE